MLSDSTLVVVYIRTCYLQWRLQEFCLGGSLKILIKKKVEYIELPTKKKKNLIHEVLQFPSSSIQILNFYIIVHYKYLLPMWVAMSL